MNIPARRVDEARRFVENSERHTAISYLANDEKYWQCDEFGELPEEFKGIYYSKSRGPAQLHLVK